MSSWGVTAGVAGLGHAARRHDCGKECGHFAFRSDQDAAEKIILHHHKSRCNGVWIEI